ILRQCRVARFHGRERPDQPRRPGGGPGPVAGVTEHRSEPAGRAPLLGRGLMRTKNRSNLQSPRTIRYACDLDDLDGWFRQEAGAVGEPAIRAVVLGVHEHLDAFVRWPRNALLLWEGRDRSLK